MSRFPVYIYCIFLLAIMSAGCKGADSDRAVPRPVAWPRIPFEANDSMSVIEGLPVNVEINPSATWTRTDSETPGITVTYPGVNAEIYFTFIPVSGNTDVQNVIDARQERMMLNLNGAGARTIIGYDKQGERGVAVIARTGCQTPVQLLAQLPGYVVTATAFLHDPRVTEAYDSIKPLIDILEHDMTRALPDIKFDTK